MIQVFFITDFSSSVAHHAGFLASRNQQKFALIPPFRRGFLHQIIWSHPVLCMSFGRYIPSWPTFCDLLVLFSLLNGGWILYLCISLCVPKCYPASINYRTHHLLITQRAMLQLYNTTKVFSVVLFSINIRDNCKIKFFL